MEAKRCNVIWIKKERRTIDTTFGDYFSLWIKYHVPLPRLSTIECGAAILYVYPECILGYYRFANCFPSLWLLSVCLIISLNFYITMIIYPLDLPMSMLIQANHKIYGVTIYFFVAFQIAILVIYQVYYLINMLSCTTSKHAVQLFNGWYSVRLVSISQVSF